MKKTLSSLSVALALGFGMMIILNNNTGPPSVDNSRTTTTAQETPLLNVDIDPISMALVATLDCARSAPHPWSNSELVTGPPVIAIGHTDGTQYFDGENALTITGTRTKLMKSYGRRPRDGDKRKSRMSGTTMLSMARTSSSGRSLEGQSLLIA